MLLRGIRPTPFRTARSRPCSRGFTVLAFESSADDTCAAVVTSSREILSNVVLKQMHIHAGLGGIHPGLAVLEHQKNMPIAARRALQEARMDIQDIDGIAFTRGPGMGTCLGVACNAAKTLAAITSKPLVGVHHMQAHALTPLLLAEPASAPRFPFLTLLISGGHTLLVLAQSHTAFRVLASTVDESIGTTFDQVARALGLEWGTHGLGASLEHFCTEAESSTRVSQPTFPVTMRGQWAFSYGGLHSSVERYLAVRGGHAALHTDERRAIACAFQRAAVTQLEDKVLLGLRWCDKEGLKVGDVVVSGGVASNSFLRQRLRACIDNEYFVRPITLSFPPPTLCTDNAAMVAWASMHRFLANDTDDFDVAPRAKWSIEELAS